MYIHFRAVRWPDWPFPNDPACLGLIKSHLLVFELVLDVVLLLLDAFPLADSLLQALSQLEVDALALLQLLIHILQLEVRTQQNIQNSSH